MRDSEHPTGAASKPPVDMTKASAPTESSSTAPTQPPRTVRLAIAAIIAEVVLGVGYAVLAWPAAHTLRNLVHKANLKQKHPKAECNHGLPKGCLNLDKTVHAIQVQGLITSLVVGAAILILIPRLRRGNRSGRTIYVAIALFAGLLGYVGSPVALTALIAGGPGAQRVVAILAALASVLAIVALFLRESQEYINERSPRPAGALGPRPGLGGLFRPPGPRQPAERVPGMRTNPRRGEQRAEPPASRPAARSKSRQDADSIARGAQLARNRAKASKSRRTDS